MNTISKSEAQTIKAIVNTFSVLNGTSFVGIKGYTSKTSGETANHVVIANFSYDNAIEKDLKALQGATNEDCMNIAEKGKFSLALVEQAINKLKDSFTNNKNIETASAGSIAQSDAYIAITNSIKLHVATRQIHIYALHVSKQVLVEGVHKHVNSRELTLAQNAVKKYFNFSTSNYRQFIVDKDMLTGVNVNGEKYSLKD